MSQQGLLQQSIRGITGTALDYNGDWLALMASDSITTGTFNERLLAWINVTLGASFTSLPAAQQALAVDQGYSSWATMGAITLGGGGGGPSGSGYLLEDGSSYLLAENSNYLILE